MPAGPVAITAAEGGLLPLRRLVSGDRSTSVVGSTDIDAGRLLLERCLCQSGSNETSQNTSLGLKRNNKAVTETSWQRASRQHILEV